MFTKQHYKAIAKAIRESDSDIAPLWNPDGKNLDKEILVTKLCELFAEDNPLFDKGKFFNACMEGYEG